MSESIDFKAFHDAYYDKLKKENPEKDYCRMCFDNKNVKGHLCEDCLHVQEILSTMKNTC